MAAKRLSEPSCKGGVVGKKMADNLNIPAQIERLRAAPRYSAKAKRSGERCQGPAVKGWRVCSVHGAHGVAPRGVEAPELQAWRSDSRSDRGEALA